MQATTVWSSLPAVLAARKFPRFAVASHGFTLIELMVALAVMAMLALMSWRGIDAMVSVQTDMRQRSDAVATLQTGLTQWSADLDALVETPYLPALDFDGRVLRLTRRDTAAPDGPVRVVGWTRVESGQQGTWSRWQSPPLRSRVELKSAWTQVQLWSQSPGAAQRQREVAIFGLMQWQLFYYRNNSWSNPSSTAGPSTVTGTVEISGGPAVPSAPVFPPLPDGIRLVLTLPAGQPVSGVLTRDWIRPVIGGGKS